MPNELIEQKQAQMRKGLIEFCILLAIADGRIYASEIINKLKAADLLLVEGTLYPLLSRLRTQGLLTYDWEESPAGPPRKYYQLTVAGETTLRELKKTWTSLKTSINKLNKPNK